MDYEQSSDIHTVAIIGLGLIGGSLARDLHARGVRVLGADQNADDLAAAVREKVVERLADDFADIGQADVVVLAVPVRAALKLLRTLAPRLADVRLITDVGSTKASIVRAAEELGLGDRFVGSHPIAGDHTSGWSASRVNLFADARVFLTPAPSASGRAIQLADALWRLTRPVPQTMDAAAHDRRVAWTSHLPQIVSSALGCTLAGENIAWSELGPGGKSVTRLAGSSPEMWTDIALDNAAQLVPALKAMEARLRQIRGLIANGKDTALNHLLADARTWHTPAS
jgi:prephenate dehydrogenase